MSVLSLAFLDQMHDATGLLDLAPAIRDKRDRMALECVFPLAAQFTRGDDITSSLQGLYLDAAGRFNGYRSRSLCKFAMGR